MLIISCLPSGSGIVTVLVAVSEPSSMLWVPLAFMSSAIWLYCKVKVGIYRM